MLLTKTCNFCVHRIKTDGRVLFMGMEHVYYTFYFIIAKTAPTENKAIIKTREYRLKTRTRKKWPLFFSIQDLQDQSRVLQDFIVPSIPCIDTYMLCVCVCVWFATITVELLSLCCNNQEVVSYCGSSPAIVVVSPPCGSVEWERIDHSRHQIESSGATVETQRLQERKQHRLISDLTPHPSGVCVSKHKEEIKGKETRHEPFPRVCLCVCASHQFSPGDLWDPAVNPSEVGYKEANGQGPTQDREKHEPAESRHEEILCAPDQNPHHHARNLQGRRKKQWYSADTRSIAS